MWNMLTMVLIDVFGKGAFTPSENWICSDQSWSDLGPVCLLESVVVCYGWLRDQFGLFHTHSST